MRFVALDIETTGTDIANDQILEVAMIKVDTKKHPSTWETFSVFIEHDKITAGLDVLIMHHELFREMRYQRDLIKKLEKENNELYNNSYMYIAGERLTDEQFKENELIKEKLRENDIQLNIEKNKFIPIDKLGEKIKFFLSGYDICNPFKGCDQSKNFLNSYIVFAGKNVGTFDVPLLKPFLPKDMKIAHRTIDPTMLYTDFINDEMPPESSLLKKRVNVDGIDVNHRALDDAWDIVYAICKHIGYDFDNQITSSKLTKLGFTKRIVESLDDFQFLRFRHEESNIEIHYRSYEDIFHQFKLIGEGYPNQFIWNMKELENIMNNG